MVNEYTFSKEVGGGGTVCPKKVGESSLNITGHSRLALFGVMHIDVMVMVTNVMFTVEEGRGVIEFAFTSRAC